MGNTDMTVFILTFLVMVIIVGAMSVGVIFGRAPIKGSCGGISALGLGTECEICGGNPAHCEGETKPSAGAELGYDAMDHAEGGDRASIHRPD